MSLPAKRDPAEITQESAAHIAKYLIGEQIKNDRSMPMMTRLTMQAACAKDGGVDQIAEVLYGMGLKIAIDKNNPEHKEWLESGAAELEK